MLARDQPSLPVTRVAVRVVGGLAIDADSAGFLFPFQYAVVGDVAPQQIAAIAEIHRSFRPAATGGQTIHRGQRQAILVEAGVDHLHSGIGIALAWFPHDSYSPDVG